MRSSTKNTIISILECSLITFVITSCVFIFLRVFKAEGFPSLLLSWTILSCILLFISFRLNKVPSLLPIIIRIFTSLLIVTAGIFLLLQLGATQRSLAEAWLDYARKGTAFGFFSFFAAEIYAIMLIFSFVFISNRQYLTGISIFFTVNFLCIGIISGQQIYLIFAVLFLICPLLYKKRWQSFIFPFVCAAIITSVVAITEFQKGYSFTSEISFDSSNIMQTVAPDFPLMIHIPGYGFSANAAKPLNSVSLSARPIFELKGNPYQTYYFITDKFSAWYGSYWNHEYYDSDEMPVNLFFGKEGKNSISKDTQMIHMRLVEDFYSVIPFTSDTNGILLPDEYKERTITPVTTNTLEISPEIIRGTDIFLLLDKNNEKQKAELSESENLESEVSDIPPKVQLLANEVYEKSILEASSDTEKAEIDNIYIKKILSYLKDGFTYSLDTPIAPANKNSIEYFLFESKTGFCTWYATAFTLLMQSQYIPCHMVEGFRTTLNDKGQGSITGLQDHSWPEVFIDGNWKIFEPTPVYTTDNPYAFINSNDKKTLKLFSNNQKTTEESKQNTNFVNFLSSKCMTAILIITLFLIFVATIIFFVIYKKPEKRLVRHAKRIVKKYMRKGISSPSEIGWIEWKYQALKIDNENQNAIEKIANTMIHNLYD